MPANSRKQAHELVQQALINNLARKGVSYTATGGGVTVAYLIVVGNKRMTGVHRLLGSVPRRVSQWAPCSVLILRTT